MDLKNSALQKPFEALREFEIALQTLLLAHELIDAVLKLTGLLVELAELRALIAEPEHDPDEEREQQHDGDQEREPLVIDLLCGFAGSHNILRAGKFLHLYYALCKAGFQVQKPKNIGFEGSPAPESAGLLPIREPS